MENKGLWQAVLGELEVTLSRANFATWFRHTAIVGNNSGHITIAVPNIFNKEWLEKKYHPDILAALGKVVGHVKSVEYKIMLPDAKPDQPAADQAIEPDVVPVAARVKGSSNQTSPSGLNERYSFDNFVVGASNELAYAACQAVSRHPGSKYNPLFLYGGVGLGKTHLMQAVGNEVRRRQPDAKVVYVTSESFTNEFVYCLARKKTEAFTDKYRGVDVLIIDDVQFLAGKEKTVEEFFHTFNALHQSNRQVIISSDKPPKAIPALEERMRSRFEWGMTADVQPPDLETRSAILMRKAATGGFDLPPEVVDYMARNIQHNIRELEGALTQLIAYCELRGLSPSIAAVSGLMGNLNTAQRTRLPSAKAILEKTARYYDLQIDDLTGPKRDKEIVVPRQTAMYLMRHELSLSFPKIAAAVGGRDHTTAMHSVSKIERQVELDEMLRTEISAIKEQLRTG